MTLGGALAWASVAYGLAFLVKDATIFARPRDWLARLPSVGPGFFAALWTCAFCVGVWVGLGMAVGDRLLAGDGWYWQHVMRQELVWATAAGTVVYVMDLVTRKLEGTV